MQAVTFTLTGQPQSMKNSRRIVTTGRGRHRRVRLIKSADALAYVGSIQAQAAAFWRAHGLEPFTGRLRILATLYYTSERPDLDGELVCDALQGICYANDRQLRIKEWRHGIDKLHPRAEITLAEIV